MLLPQCYKTLYTNSCFFKLRCKWENSKSTRSAGVRCSVTFEICKNLWNENRKRNASKAFNTSFATQIISAENLRSVYKTSCDKYTATHQNFYDIEDILKILIFWICFFLFRRTFLNYRIRWYTKLCIIFYKTKTLRILCYEYRYMINMTNLKWWNMRKEK